MSNKDEYWFRFDEPFIENLKYAGFVWFTDGGSNYSYKPKFYQLKVKSAGGIEVHQTKDIENNEFIPEEKKIYKSL